jgi:hypothetical protein
MDSWRHDLAGRLEALDADVTWQVEERQGPKGGRLVLAASGADAVVVYANLEPAVEAISQALSDLPSEDLALVEAQLPRTVIVPLVRDRSLRGEAITLSTLVIADANWTPQWWHFVPRPMPDDLAAIYPAWDNAELQLEHRLADVIAGLFATTTHLLDLPRSDTLDDLGKDLLAAYVARIDPSLSALVAGSSRDLDLLSEAVEAMTDTEPYRGELAEAIKVLRDVIADAPQWQTASELPEAALRTWRPRIEQAVGMAGALRLAWSAAVLAPGRLDGG